MSGGEGQPVRLRRAMLPGVRLVILDEPFRGLERHQRQKLLARALKLWRDATLLCIRPGDVVRKVREQGKISFQNREFRVGKALSRIPGGLAAHLAGWPVYGAFLLASDCWDPTSRRPLRLDPVGGKLHLHYAPVELAPKAASLSLKRALDSSHPMDHVP